MSGLDFSAGSIEERPREITEPQVAVPSLNIFLGSTPAYSALEAMRQLVALPESDRRRVALVFLDIDSPPAEVLQFRQEHPGTLLEFDLRIAVAHGVLYADRLDERIAPHTYIPTKIPESFDNGAGGIRNNGHVAGCTDRAKIVQLLDEALSAVGALSLDRNARPVSEIQINIVAFLGGGTGSGILADIAVMVRHRVLQLNLKHRLNVFCLLPEHVREATTNDVSWRKSNATATLLELVALSLVRGERGPYQTYMLNTPYEVRGTSIANEIYLFGQTAMNSAEHAARIIGLDLYARITNASGVGFLERSKSVDRRTLGNYDAAGLPTMFGTTCPLEVAFPAVETATAFAQLTAARVLPELAGELSADTLQLTSSELQKVGEWDHAFEQHDEPLFDDRQFQRAGRDRLRKYEAILREHLERVEEQVDAEARTREEQEIAELSGITLRPLGEQIRLLRVRQRIFRAALNNVRGENVPRRQAPDRTLQRSLLRAWPVLGMKEKAVAAVTDNFTRVQKRGVRALVLERRRAVLERLLAYTDDQLDKVTQYRGKVESGEVVRRLESAAHASAAWRGQLENTHVHRRHIFDLPGMRGMETTGDTCAPVQRLYDLLTTELPATYAREFTTWLHERYRDDAGLMALDVMDLRDRLVQYLRDEVYLRRLAQMNLFDLLRECCVEQGERPDAKVEDLLLAHLQHIGGLARDLVAFEDQLWSDGSGNLSTTLYLGISWRDGTQRRLLDRARNRLQTIGRQGASPLLASAIDPHRMQLVYGQHAISLGTIPDFFQAANSNMGEFLHHQRAWFGDGTRNYGQSKAPVFSSGEMERLVMDATALGDEHGRSLAERVIRRHQSGAGDRPRWLDGAARAVNGIQAMSPPFSGASGSSGRWARGGIPPED